MEQNLNHIKKTKMNDKEKAQAKLDKLLKDFEDCHRKAKRLKEEMRLLKIKIMGISIYFWIGFHVLVFYLMLGVYDDDNSPRFNTRNMLS